MQQFFCFAGDANMKILWNVSKIVKNSTYLCGSGLKSFVYV